MKNIVLFIAVFISQFIFADGFTDYKDHIAKNRLLIIFDKNVPAERKTEIIQSSGLVTHFVHLPSPPLTICYTNDFDASQKFFSSVSEIKFVSFYITDGKEHYFGVLDQFFVKLKDKNFGPLLKEKLIQENLGEAKPDKYIPNLYKIQNSQYKIHNTVDWCSLFLEEGWVEYAAPDYLMNPQVNSNDPMYTREWNIHNTGTPLQGNGTPGADMKVDSAWTLTTGVPSIKIGLIDSGVDTLHADLMQNLLPGHDAVGDSTDGYPTPNYAEDGHGTCCAGILAAVKDNAVGVAGIAPDCKVIPIRSFYYLDAGGGAILPFSSASIFADAIGWAWDTAGADVLSNSWGLPASAIPFLPGGTQPVDDAIQTAYVNGRGGKGIAMFFSSGNDNDSSGPIWPAYKTQTIAVNATSMCDERKSTTDCSHETWWGGDYGIGLDFSAPGVKITTTDMRGTKGFANGDYYYLFNGTSAACPNAAGVGALLLSIRPDFTPEDVRNVIARTCDRVGGYAYDSLFFNGTWSHELGYGRINAYHALQLAITYSSVANTENNIALNIFPNPAVGILNIGMSGIKNAVMKIFDITGKELQQKPLLEGLNKEDVSFLESGIYLVKVDTGSGIVTKKITVFR